MLIAQRPGLTEDQVSEFRSRFVIEPLEPGFGYTIGNSVRRTLLSSIPGAAITSIRIEGVLHEFSTVPGVTEDVTDIILNLKELVVSSEHDEPVPMYLRKQGPGPVTAADIAPPAGVEVHNPDLHLATLNSKGKLEMELTVERGRGYVSAAQNKQPGQEIGRIPIDSIYSPVMRVTYKVEATRVEQHTVGELVARSEQDLLDIRNFGAKSIEEVKQKLIDMGLALKDSPPGFDPGTAADSYGADDDESYVETEQY
jgi:DNA-directed RNA polymerase subunit alpha